MRRAPRNRRRTPGRKKNSHGNDVDSWPHAASPRPHARTERRPSARHTCSQRRAVKRRRSHRGATTIRTPHVYGALETPASRPLSDLSSNLGRSRGISLIRCTVLSRRSLTCSSRSGCCGRLAMRTSPFDSSEEAALSDACSPCAQATRISPSRRARKPRTRSSRRR